MSIEEKIKDLGLRNASFAVFGSGPMAVRGIREASDIDLIVKKDLWDSLVASGKVQVLSDKLLCGNIEVFNSWKNLDASVDELIDSADIFNGIRYVKLKYVLEWKSNLGREKDLNDIKLINHFLSEE